MRDQHHEPHGERNANEIGAQQRQCRGESTDSHVGRAPCTVALTAQEEGEDRELEWERVSL